MTATPQMMLNRKCYQVSKPEMEFHIIYNIRSIAYVRTNRKDDIFIQRHLGQILTCILEWGQRTCKNQDRARPELTQP